MDSVTILPQEVKENNAKALHKTKKKRSVSTRRNFQAQYYLITQHLVPLLRENGKFQPSTTDRGRERTEHVIDVKPEILEIVEENPSISICKLLSYRLGVSAFGVWRTLKEKGFTHTTCSVCNPLNQKTCLVECGSASGCYKKKGAIRLLQKLLTTDEATLRREGVFNSRNTHIWTDQNPHAIRETHFQDRFSVNICAGMVDNNLIGPYVLPPRLMAAAYLDFLNNYLGPLLEDVPLNVRRDLGYLHNGAPAHYAVEVRE
ncbi:hypothetical protein Zmor_017733 [Zophobas morio]|uniref:Transposase n=1 Tax=Zophobas morio TaxID=2755281 RepID=A0AA38MD09_9CUCU|nr:hypothetical protein Zmor_017733 [Zophobas morio]